MAGQGSQEIATELPNRDEPIIVPLGMRLKISVFNSRPVFLSPTAGESVASECTLFWPPGNSDTSLDSVEEGTKHIVKPFPGVSHKFYRRSSIL